MKWQFLLLFSISVIVITLTQQASAENPNLFVSAENKIFSNHFFGPMVIEVVINDPNLHDTDQAKGEPDVTINGKQLRMVQASDGNWYAYFANLEKAKIADQTVESSTDSGVGLDFGVFCGRNTPSSVLGTSFSDSDGIAVPRISNLGGYTNGNSQFSSCSGDMASLTNTLNNVVRKPRSINTNPNVLPGQIGLDQNAWPIIQLFSFKDVTILYNAASGTQRVDLKYDSIPNISLNLDREAYPPNSEVHAIMNDFQLNIDPTDSDSWTFNVISPTATFYQAYDNNGQNSANLRSGLINLIPSLSNLGFEKNGKLSMNLGSILVLDTNDNQPNSSVTNPTVGTFSKIVTFVESQPNSGIFNSFDFRDKSTIRFSSDAARGRSGTIEYNQESRSIVSGYSTADVTINAKPSLTLGSNAQNLIPGNKISLTLFDPDQNLNSGLKEDLDVFRESATIPSLKIGNPITLDSASEVKFYSDSGSPVLIPSVVSDDISSRLIIETKGYPSAVDFEKVSVSLGVSSDQLKSSIIDTAVSNNYGSNWINYDFRSFSNDLGISDFSDASVSISVGSSTPITLIPKGSLTSQGLIQISDSVIHSIFGSNGQIVLIVDFDSSNNNVNVGQIQGETESQPIVFDFFAFGTKGNTKVNNAIYRFELEETKSNSSTFTGTVEPIVFNQLNQFDPDFIKTIKPISSDVKFLVNDRLIDEKGITISYSDIAQVGATIVSSTKSNVETSSGAVSLGSQSYRFGQPVTLTLRDPDLNLHSDLIDIYNVVDDPSSPYVDTVGVNGQILLEILIKDIRYKRCTISGQEYGGLASTGFSLVETGTSTGIFEGTFKMPSQICGKSGKQLISSAGGIVDAKYYDARDASGQSNVFTLSRSANEITSSFTLSDSEITLPEVGNTKSISISGIVQNPVRGVPLTIQVVSPDGIRQSFSSSITSSGNFKGVITLNNKSLTGQYDVILTYNGKQMGTTTFFVHAKEMPDWFKTATKKWLLDSSDYAEYSSNVKKMFSDILTSSMSPSGNQKIPTWIKNNAKWWSEGLLSDDDFLTSIQYLIKKGIILL